MLAATASVDREQGNAGDQRGAGEAAGHDGAAVAGITNRVQRFDLAEQIRGHRRRHRVNQGVAAALVQLADRQLCGAPDSEAEAQSEQRPARGSQPTSRLRGQWWWNLNGRSCRRLFGRGHGFGRGLGLRCGLLLPAATIAEIGASSIEKFQSILAIGGPLGPAMNAATISTQRRTRGPFMASNLPPLADVAKAQHRQFT